MAHSPTSAERRARLIREMARQGDRSQSRGSAGSAAGSAREYITAYDTETQQTPVARLDDFQINTSALRRAFPDFSQSGSSEASIEVGRGFNKSAGDGLGQDPPSDYPTENLSFTFGKAGRFQITGTPPLKPRNANAKIPSNNLDNPKINASNRPVEVGKENMDAVKETRYNSSSSSREDRGGGSRPGQFQASVESDDSGPIENAKNAAMKASRSTRFGMGRDKPTAISTTGAGPGAPQSLEQAIQNNTNMSAASAVNGTYQSFLLPDMPNITELISGARQDGTPLFNRSVKSRSRFATPQQTKREQKSKTDHSVLEGVPIPVEEKALYVSLQLLQEKVAALEQDRARSEKKLEEYELEVLQLKSKLEEQEHARLSDSGLGTDADEAKLKAAPGEKSKLELTIKTLQDRLDRANRKVSKSEITVKNLTKDRDAAHQQLAIAYLDSEELKSESEALQNEISRLRERVSKLNEDHEKRVQQLTSQEAELRGKIERREKAINQMSALAKELWRTRRTLTGSDDPAPVEITAEIRAPQSLRTQKQRKSKAEVAGLSQPVPPQTSSHSQARMSSKATASTEKTARRYSIPEKHNVTYNIEGDGASDAEPTTHFHVRSRPASSGELAKDPTFMSFMEGDEVAKLQEVLDEDRAKLGQPPYRPHTTVEKHQGPAQQPPLPRKSSLKKVQYGEKNDAGLGNNQSRGEGRIFYDRGTIDTVDEKTSHSIKGDNQPTQHSVMSRGSERRRPHGANLTAEVTSAFILPDITLTGAAMKARGANWDSGVAAKKTMSVPRPIPVSDREPVLVQAELDVTIRPAQSPGLALATVLTCLEDELADLRGQLAQQETLYNQHDPALSKRKRKIVYARIQKLLGAMEARSDQIYALYDVLEGQKVSGQIMKEEEVEVTLQTIGIDLATARQLQEKEIAKVGSTKSPHANMYEDDDSATDDDLDYSDELPWEGIEPTQTQTLDRFGRISVQQDDRR